ncbi:hypothetical protein CLV46_0491 [Diaminobutyricimonas aerilata]|uniref:Uncharacterized protein n=1 Tax=Diaminobutyricimonas aerilata TaxID=1162967 RepID=A0A2M9CGE6_9MICO|nr:hypothetical protein [Diaminobutyricimonas aerilata]PJJ70959.1 hypothetical protein CLV46_0491 [Diaminobutyricimonas aerilata]
MTTRPFPALGPAPAEEAADPFHLDDPIEAEHDEVQGRRDLGLRVLGIALEPVKYAFPILWLLAAGVAFVVAQLWIVGLRMRNRPRPAATAPATRPVAIITRDLPRAA